MINERRQNYENRPYGLAGMALSAAMYPPEHPYHWLTIGSAEDLRATTLDEVHAFFKTYYHPANASLSLAGDIETKLYRAGNQTGKAADKTRSEIRHDLEKLRAKLRDARDKGVY